MHLVNVALAVIGGVILFLDLTARYVRDDLYISEALLATGFGVLIGPAVLNWIDLYSIGDPEVVLEQVARFTVGIALMGVALRLPVGYFRRNWRPLALVLGVGMLLMWVISGLLVFWICSIPFGLAMLAGAIVTPTDPVIAGSIVTGQMAEKNISPRVRNLISAESGANDGLAYPLVLLPILLLSKPAGHALGDWFVEVILWEVLGAVVIGGLIGLAAAFLQRRFERQEAERSSMLTITVALSVLVLSVMKLMGTDGILAVFAAGVVYRNVKYRRERPRQEEVQEAVVRLSTVPALMLFGMMLPWSLWIQQGWTALAVAVAVLFLRRLPMMFLISPLMKPLKDKYDTLFVGWFGPIGVAAIFYTTLTLRTAGSEQVYAIATMITAVSILIHGATATPFTKLYGRACRKAERTDEDQ